MTATDFGELQTIDHHITVVPHRALSDANLSRHYLTALLLHLEFSFEVGEPILGAMALPNPTEMIDRNINHDQLDREVGQYIRRWFGLAPQPIA